MSYTKTKWITNDLITAEKLNKIEEGLEQAESNSPLIVTVTFNSNYVNDMNDTTVGIGDKTYSEVISAIDNNQPVIAKISKQIIAVNSELENYINEFKLDYEYCLILNYETFEENDILYYNIPMFDLCSNADINNYVKIPKSAK